jgi:hypothetical protein
MRDAAVRCAEHAANFCGRAVGFTPVAAKGEVAKRFRVERRRRLLLW